MPPGVHTASSLLVPRIGDVLQHLVCVRRSGARRRGECERLTYTSEVVSRKCLTGGAAGLGMGQSQTSSVGSTRHGSRRTTRRQVDGDRPGATDVEHRQRHQVGSR